MELLVLLSPTMNILFSEGTLPIPTSVEALCTAVIRKQFVDLIMLLQQNKITI
jgi:hypothetical protein